MPRRFKTEPTALRTGLGHAAMSFGAIALIGGAAAGIVEIAGKDGAGSPRVNIALFTEKPGAAPILKSRTEDGAVQTAAGHHDSRNPDAHGEGPPTLPVSSPGQVDNHGVTITRLNGEKDGGVEQASVQFGEDSAERARIETVDAKRVPLPRAPIAGLTERGAVGLLPRIADDGRTPAEVYARPFVATDKPKISIIVGGLGLKRSMTEQAIRDLPPEVTLSFAPYSPNLQSYVNQARAAGHEVLLETPMEPYDYPNVDPGPETLLTTLSEEENERRLNIILGKTTGYFGLINYQGAKIATDSRTVDPILSAVAKRGLAFIYDGGAPRSVFPTSAEAASLRFAEADRIVDTRPSPEAIDRNLLQLEALALQNGHALGVGFAYPVTIDQFLQWAETLKYRGYELVPASSAAGVTAVKSSADSGA